MVLLLIVLALTSCAKGGGTASAGSWQYALAEGERAAGLSYDAAWSSTAYLPEGPAGLEGQTPPAFRDMSSLYGETTAAREPEAPAPNRDQAAPEKDRKLIKTARIQIRVDNLKESAALVETILERYGAYASSSSVRDTSRTYTLKIPNDKYETALGEIAAIGKIIYQSENVEDTTIRFYDLEGRLNTRLELLKTFQAYLGKAATIDEIMIVEKRIAELQQEIDWYGSQLADLSHLIDFATVNLELMGPVSESVHYKPSLGERIAELFRSFADIASMALLVLLGILIYGIPALLVLVLLFWVLFGRIGLIRRIWRLAGVHKGKIPD
jgi:hypothetical protein